MKTLNYLCTLLLIAGSFTMTAQSSVNASHIDEVLENELPVIGVRYEFYPNLDAYYDKQSNVYVFQSNGSWVKARQLPTGYRGYSIMNNIKHEITDYNGDQPQTKLADHQRMFPKNYSAKRRPPKDGKAQDIKIAFN